MIRGIDHVSVQARDYEAARRCYVEVLGFALYAEKTLEYVYTLWGRPVNLETQLEDQPTVFTYDGGKHDREAI